MAGLAVVVVLITGSATVASADPDPGNGCAGQEGWVRGGTWLAEYTSQWLSSRADIAGGARIVQFKTTGGNNYRWLYASCALGTTTRFPTASYYRIKSQSGGIGGWVLATRIEGSRLYSWPNQCAGYDPLTSYWLRWTC